jgi:catechol 2,3-dioxygenase-like lactoylglutathione lyase family enzyme
MVTRARHTGVVVADIDRAQRFYETFLNLKVARRMEESGPFIETLLGLPGVNVTTVKMEGAPGQIIVELLYFHSHKDPAPRPPAPYSIGPTHMALTVDDVDGLYEKMSAAGTPFISRPQLSVDGIAKVAFCRDPDGMMLELVQMVG